MVDGAAPAAGFDNVRAVPWHRRGVLAGQTAYAALALVIITALVAVLAGNFLTPGNLQNISRNFSYIGLISLGMTCVIITGGIDLSVGSVTALVAVTCMLLMRWLGTTPLAGVPYAQLVLPILLGLLLAGVIGAVNGLLVARVGL